ncbi:MAG: hypothetical protein JWO06_3524, partial [Bacteroidota bacterium]|nr:hypothetical protein [Bacteroidota bacterium]
MDIAFEKPESLVPEHNKPLAIANADYPLISIDHRRFEKLNYWVFRTEIENGGWKGKYQDIRLMSGVSDGGKDCAIYNDDVLVAVIQCKHSENNNALTVPIFLKEIIKFGIYWTQDNSIVPDPSNFEYYISSSSGFNEDCTNLIADFHKKVTEIKELGKYANSVINSYASLKDINYTTIEVALKDFFALITVIKIDKEEINRLLTKPYQHLTIKAFFDIKTVIDGVAIEPLKDEIRELGKDIQKITKKSINIDDVLSSFKAASYHLLNWNSFIDSGDKVHIERTQVGPILNWVQSPINEKDKPIALLAGDAGVGKTVVLKAVYQKLLELDIPVLGLKADKLYAGDIEELEKQLDFRESIVDMVKTLRNEHEKVVILVDQIDALSQSLSSDRKFLNAYNLLIQKLAAIQGVRIIISVRSFDLRYDPHLKTLKKNKTFELVPLTDQELKTALSNLAIPFNKLNLRLYNTLKVPHHLYVFCQVYNSSLSLDGIQELQDLYDELWKQKVLSLPHVLKINSTECVQLIYDIADRMNKAEQITVHRKSFEEKYDVVDYLISNNILTSDGNELQFFHQTFYDYSYARHFVESENSV